MDIMLCNSQPEEQQCKARNNGFKMCAFTPGEYSCFISKTIYCITVMTIMLTSHKLLEKKIVVQVFRPACFNHSH